MNPEDILKKCYLDYVKWVLSKTKRQRKKRISVEEKVNTK